MPEEIKEEELPKETPGEKSPSPEEVPGEEEELTPEERRVYEEIKREIEKAGGLI
jgi:hypothetical protein